MSSASSVLGRDGSSTERQICRLQALPPGTGVLPGIKVILDLGLKGPLIHFVRLRLQLAMVNDKVMEYIILRIV